MTILAISACTSSKQEINLPSDDSLAIEKVMHEGRLLRTELLKQNGELFYVERVAFKDWHVSLHNLYLISDRLCDGHTIVEQSWNNDDFCNISIRLEDHTFALIRQLECIALVRIYRSMPIDEFDSIARPLIMKLINKIQV